MRVVGWIDASRNRHCHNCNRHNDNIFQRVGLTGTEAHSRGLNYQDLPTSFGIAVSAIIQAVWEIGDN